MENRADFCIFGETVELRIDPDYLREIADILEHTGDSVEIESGIGETMRISLYFTDEEREEMEREQAEHEEGGDAYGVGESDQ